MSGRAVGVATVPGGDLKLHDTGAWPVILQERELAAYGRGVEDGAYDRAEIRAAGFVEGAALTARALGDDDHVGGVCLPSEALEVAQRIGDSVTPAEAIEQRAYWKGWYEGETGGYARGRAEGLVDGWNIGRERDPASGRPEPSLTSRVARAFRLGRQIERQRWERRLQRGELS